MTTYKPEQHRIEKFDTPVKISEGFYHTGRVYGACGRFIRDTYHYGRL